MLGLLYAWLIYSLDAAGDEQFGFLLVDILRLLRADFGSRTRGVALTPQLHRLLLLCTEIPAAGRSNWPTGSRSRR